MEDLLTQLFDKPKDPAQLHGDSHRHCLARDHSFVVPR